MSTVQIIVPVLLIFLIVGSAVLFLLFQESRRKKIMLSKIKGRSSRMGKKAADEKDAQNKRREEIAKKLKSTKEEELGEKNKKATLPMLISQAGLEITVKKFWVLSIGLMIALAVVTKILGQPIFVVLMAAIIGLLGLPRLVLKNLAARRQKKFLQEFPDALEATVRLLKAGMPVSEAVLMISKEFSGPVGEEMSRIYDQQRIGVALHEAALAATKRMPISEMQMFATGLAIQAQTGSSLSEVLMNLSNVIRARFRLKRKIKALSSEAVVSASIIGALPNFVAISLYFVNREYITILFTDSFGKVLLAGAVIWMCIGVFIMKAMINFKV